MENFKCERCSSSGPLHYRVRSDEEPVWILVCPCCWQKISQQQGYQYGGTRKANRRQRRR